MLLPSFCTLAHNVSYKIGVLQCELESCQFDYSLKSLVNLSVALSSLQVQTVLKKVPVAAPNQTEPILVNRKKLEYKWGMNVLGELMINLYIFFFFERFEALCCPIISSHLIPLFPDVCCFALRSVVFTPLHVGVSRHTLLCVFLKA